MYELFIDARTRTALVLVAVFTYKLWKCVTCLWDAAQPRVQLADIRLGSFARMSERN